MRSEAQKAADKRYREKKKERVTHWATELKAEEAAAVDELIKARGMNRAQFIRWAADKLKAE